MEDEGPALIGLTVVGVGGADDDVGVAVAVDVARRRDRECEVRAGLIAFRRPRWGRRQASCRPVVDGGTALSSLTVLVDRCADDDIREAVSVEVACRRNRVAEHRKGLVALGSPRRVHRQPSGRAVEDECPSLSGLAVVEVRRADDDIGEAVAVDIAR
jgi:hypothetical protein